MNSSELITTARKRGVALWADGAALRWHCREGLPGELRAELVAHKVELLAALEAVNAPSNESPSDRGRRRLAILAKESGHSLADLLDWYNSDLADLGTDTEANVRTIVGDYITRVVIYRESSETKEVVAYTTRRGSIEYTF